jgi:hypothetical protein
MALVIISLSPQIISFMCDSVAKVYVNLQLLHGTRKGAEVHV